MKRQLAFIGALGAMISTVCWSAPQAFAQTELGQDVKQEYEAYVQAWKLKDIAALQKLIADEYMAMNFEIKLSDKQNEIATAKTDAEWISMNIDEIHTQVFGNTAIASGLLRAQGKRPDRTTFSARVRFLAALVKRGVSISRPAKIIIVWANQSCRTGCDFDPQFVKECK